MAVHRLFLIGVVLSVLCAVPAALAASGDTRQVVSDEHATYFGTELADDSLVPGPDAELGSITYEAWAKESA